MRRWLAGVLLVIGGCDGGGSRAVEPTLRFSRLDEPTINRLVLASLGEDANRAIILLDDLRRSWDGACPIIELDGDITTFGGYCVGYRGASLYFEVAGAVRVIRGERYIFDRFAVQGYPPTNEGPGFFDGTIDTGGSIDIELVVDKEFGVIRSVLAIARALDQRDLAGGVELVGSGGALVSGSVTTRTGDYLLDGTGAWTLEGDDTLDVTLEAGCGVWQIRGTQRRGALSCEL